MGVTRQPVRHPLAELRTSAGYSHGAYARAVAEAHQALGFGAMAARREKVCRWESGRVEPELSAQFAIAHLHRVPREDVLRLGWPGWLHVPSGRAALLEAPWTLEEAVRALSLSATEEAAAPGRDPGRDFAPVSTSAQVARLATSWWQATDGTEAMTLPTPLSTQCVGMDTVAALEQRHCALQQMFSHLGAATARPAADADLRLVADLVKNARCDSATRTRLLSVAANVAALSGFLAFDVGDQVRAQSCYVTALRAATTAGDRQTGAWAFMLLARQQLEWRGDSRMAADLMDVADGAVRRAPPNARMSAVLAITQAMVHAHRGDRDRFGRDVNAALEAAAVPQGEGDPYFTHWASDEMIIKMAASSAIGVGETERAAELYGPCPWDPGGAPRPTNREDAIEVSSFGRFHVAHGDIVAAMRCVEKVDDFLAGVTSVGARFVHRQLCADLDAHSAVRAVG